MRHTSLNRRQFLGIAAASGCVLNSFGGSLAPGADVVIDAHVHLEHSGRYADPAALVQLADEAGIDVLCCSAVAASAYDMRRGNQQMVDAVRRYPNRIIGFVNIPSADLGRAVLDEIEERALRDGFRGLGEIKTPVSLYEGFVPAVSRSWLAVFRKAAALKLPMLLHQRPEVVRRIAEQVPEGTVIMAHMGNGDLEGNWRLAIEVAERCPNVYLETCGSTVDLGYIEAACAAVGAERVIFGTDLPLLDPHVQLAKIAGARIDEQARKRILGKNMARLLRLTERAV